MTESTEEMIQRKNLNAPRVTPALIAQKIVGEEIVMHTTRSGSILRWCVLEMENGFTITGKPSASVSAANDDAEVGEKVARDNAMAEVWPMEGYLLKQELYERDLEGSNGTY